MMNHKQNKLRRTSMGMKQKSPNYHDINYETSCFFRMWLRVKMENASVQHLTFILRAAFCPSCRRKKYKLHSSSTVLSPGNMIHHRSEVSWPVQLHCLQTLVVCL